MSAAAVLIGLALMSFLHELGHELVARLLRLRVVAVSFGLGPPIFRRTIRGTDLLIGPLPFGGFVRVAGIGNDDGLRPSWPKQLAVTLGGSAANYVIAAVLGIILAIGWGVGTGRILGLEVTQVSMHASSQGLRVGDVVTAVDGSPVTSVDELRAKLRTATRGPARLEVKRGSQSLTFPASPEDPTRPGLGARYVPRPDLRSGSVGAAIASGIVEPLRTSGGLLVGAGRWFAPNSDAQRPVSAVGLAARVEKSGSWDLRRILSFAALLSVIVGLFNLLPIPGLDGGRASLILAEAAVRRPLQGSTSTAIQIGGALVLLVVWIVLIALDLIGG